MPYSDSKTDSDDEICYTPSAATHASVLESGLDLPSYATSTRKAATPVPPHRDATFIIRDRSTGLVIALEDGNLGLYPDEDDPNNNASSGSGAGKTFQHSRSSHWKCVENAERYFGFRAAGSGDYLGHNGHSAVGEDWRFRAEKKHHEWWEWFTVQHQPDSGYVLLVKHNHEFRTMRVSGRDRRLLVVTDREEKGTAWDFIKVR